MKTDVEELLRDGMVRFTAQVRAPQGLASTAGRLRRRRTARRAMVAGGTVTATAATAAAVILATGAAGGTAARTGSSLTQARETAFVVTRVEHALASEDEVYRGTTISSFGRGTTDQRSVTWAYGPRTRFEEFTGGAVRYLATGTALIHGKLTGAYVAYYDHTYSLGKYVYQRPGGGYPKHGLGAASPASVPRDWAAYIKEALACGSATVTGQVRINGVETTKITGKPVTVRLSGGYGKVVNEKYARGLWTLYVTPSTYLPVRTITATETFGGSAGRTRFESVTDVRWLPPTPANQAKALVTIPPGYQRVSSAASQ